MNEKLTGNELYNLYNYRKNFLFLYRKTEKGFHPYFEGYLCLLSNNGKCEVKWNPISDSSVYGWDRVDNATSKDEKAMIRAIFEKDLNPSLKEVLY